MKTKYETLWNNLIELENFAEIRWKFGEKYWKILDLGKTLWKFLRDFDKKIKKKIENI